MNKGLIKMKGDIPSISPERFVQHPVEYYQPLELLRKEMIGYCVFNNIYWVLVKEDEGYVRVPFARSLIWFKALTSDPEFICIRKLPLLYITGLA